MYGNIDRYMNIDVSTSVSLVYIYNNVNHATDAFICTYIDILMYIYIPVSIYTYIIHIYMYMYTEIYIYLQI